MPCFGCCERQQTHWISWEEDTTLKHEHWRWIFLCADCDNLCRRRNPRQRHHWLRDYRAWVNGLFEKHALEEEPEEEATPLTASLPARQTLVNRACIGCHVFSWDTCLEWRECDYIEHEHFRWFCICTYCKKILDATPEEKQHWLRVYQINVREATSHLELDPVRKAPERQFW